MNLRLIVVEQVHNQPKKPANGANCCKVEIPVPTKPKPLTPEDLKNSKIPSSTQIIMYHCT